MEGPPLGQLAEIADDLDAELIYSGGVGSLADLEALAATGLPALGGVIVGRALYEGRFDVAEALDALDADRYPRPDPALTYLGSRTSPCRELRGLRPRGRDRPCHVRVRSLAANLTPCCRCRTRRTPLRPSTCHVLDRGAREAMIEARCCRAATEAADGRAELRRLAVCPAREMSPGSWTMEPQHLHVDPLLRNSFAPFIAYRGPICSSSLRSAISSAGNAAALRQRRARPKPSSRLVLVDVADAAFTRHRLVVASAADADQSQQRSEQQARVVVRSLTICKQAPRLCVAETDSQG